MNVFLLDKPFQPDVIRRLPAIILNLRFDWLASF